MGDNQAADAGANGRPQLPATDRSVIAGYETHLSAEQLLSELRNQPGHVEEVLRSFQTGARSAPGSMSPPALHLDSPDTGAPVTQRRWPDPPRAAVSVMWRPVMLGAEGTVPTWFGETVDPLTFDHVDVFDDREEAERRQTVLFAVAGAHHRPEIVERPQFAVGRQVLLVPDPRNTHDRNAIEVRSATGQYVVGFVPQDRLGSSFAQGLLHSWLARGPVAALILSKRAWTGDDGETRRGLTVLASPRIECVNVPAQEDAEYAEFIAARLRARADAWPHRRRALRREIERADDLEDRHFAIQTLIQEAYRLRDAHPEALDDAVVGCREQIDLAPQVAALMRQRYEPYGNHLPDHTGYRQLAIILEKRKAYAEAAELVTQARTQGWNGDWDKRLERLRRKLQP